MADPHLETSMSLKLLSLEARYLSRDSVWNLGIESYHIRNLRFFQGVLFDSYYMIHRDPVLLSVCHSITLPEPRTMSTLPSKQEDGTSIHPNAQALDSGVRSLPSHFSFMSISNHPSVLHRHPLPSHSSLIGLAKGILWITSTVLLPLSWFQSWPSNWWSLWNNEGVNIIKPFPLMTWALQSRVKLLGMLYQVLYVSPLLHSKIAC